MHSKSDDYVDFKIKVDSVAVPDTVAVNDSLIVKFYGMVGTNGCSRFKYFEVFQNLNGINFTLWGTRPNYNTVCPAVIIYLNGKKYKTVLKHSGEYKIIVHQPDGSLYPDSVYMK